MCSIIGFSKRSIPESEAIAGFETTKSRGSDMSRFVEAKSGWLGFHRLAIMGLSPNGMQPLELSGDMVICNGELYGFRPIKMELLGMGYRFKSGSDCEITLPMYHEFGLGMFTMLDAEFAMIIYDSKKDSLIAARDPIGIRPLFYGYLHDGSIVFASEAKNLVGLCEEIVPFPPGCYWSDGEFTRSDDRRDIGRAFRLQIHELRPHSGRIPKGSGKAYPGDLYVRRTSRRPLYLGQFN